MSPKETLKIDHVTIAGAELAPMERAFASLNLAPKYGGPHSNGVTHMALLGFRDGSYIELISAMEPAPKAAAFWSEHIAGDAGPCAWAVQVEDIEAEAARVAALGIKVEGPSYYYRRRPDEKLVEWDLVILGDQGIGAKLPFIMKDLTPRSRRVTPTASVAEGPLVGVATVILGVHNLEASVELFRQVYNWPAPAIKTDSVFGARLAYFEETPVVLASPLAKEGWLWDRLDRFGEAPAAYLIGADDFEAACGQFELVQTGPWFDRPVAWFDPDKLNGVRLGVVN